MKNFSIEKYLLIIYAKLNSVRCREVLNPLIYLSKGFVQMISLLSDLTGFFGELYNQSMTKSKRSKMHPIFYIAMILMNLILVVSSCLQADLYRRKEELNVLVCRTTPVEVDDKVLVERVVKAYQLASKQHLGNSMWQMFFDQYHKKIHEVFQSGQLDQATYVLRNPGANDLFSGIDYLRKADLPKFDSYEFSMNETLTSFDRLIRLGEAIGAIKLDNPVPPKYWDAQFVIDKLEKFLGFTLNFPNPYSDEVGVWTSRGVVSYRAPQALYQAWLIKNLVKDIPNPKILEIGAGLGRTAYYARMFGIEDYTIIDIPMTATASSYFLGRTLGEEQILLLGESCENPDKRIKILTPDSFIGQFDETYDLIINVDSLTEMDFSVAKAYVNTIEKTTSIFVSINHEVNPFTAREILIKSQFLKECTRNNYWMRSGYCEEIFKFNK